MSAHGSELLNGIIEMDETYVGGKPRKGTGYHKRGRWTDKIPVVGMIERLSAPVLFYLDKLDSLNNN